MKRLFLGAALLAAASASALGQSSTATSGTTQPMQTAPVSGNSSGTTQNGKAVIPPAARSGEKGLSVGEGAVSGDNPVGIKRNK